MKTIAISGTTCVGKTTLIKQLLPHYKGSFVVQEQAEKNPFFTRCFCDDNESSFKSQLMFYVEHLNHIAQCYKSNGNNGIVFFDRFIDEHRLISKFRYDIGELTENEYYICKNLADSIKAISPKLDKIIYLHCSLDTVIERKKQRKKEWDEDIDIEKIKKLMDDYNAWFKAFMRDNPHVQTLSVDTDLPIDIDGIISFINS